MNQAALVVMAAGMASRYGGNKQIEGMGPNGEILMEYSIYDAIRAGFTKVVFIIKREMLPTMKALCGDRLEKQIEVCYAFQDFESLPAFYDVPAERVKPYGTVHAVLCAREFIREPFAVINADDYYGVESFAQMYAYLTSAHADSEAAMMGYRLRNTVSRHGTVTRGLCRVEGDRLVGVREAKRICRRDDETIEEISDAAHPEVLDLNAPVSMNFWGFPKEIFPAMQDYFETFLRRTAPDDLTCECLLPVMVDRMICADRLCVHVLETPAEWFGVTYKEDRPHVVAALRALHDRKVYPSEGIR